MTAELGNERKMPVLATNSNLNHSELMDENVMDEIHCNTGDLMGPLGLLVQAVLAFLAFTSLICKLSAGKTHQPLLGYFSKLIHHVAVVLLI